MRCDRYKDDPNYQGHFAGESNAELQSYDAQNGDSQRIEEPVYHYERAKKKKSKAPLIILLVLVFLAGAGFGGYYYYSHYMKPIKVNIWNLIEEPSFTGVETEGVPNPITLNQKKLNKFIKQVESKYTSDRANDLKKIITKMTFTVTPNSALSNGTSVEIVCTYDYKEADNGRFNFDMKDGKNPKTLTKKYKVSGLQKEAELSDILSSFKDRANGTISGATFEKFYQLTKGDESRLAAIVSVSTDGKLCYKCILTEPITKSNALTVGFSEYTTESTVTDPNQFVNLFKDKGYTCTQI